MAGRTEGASAKPAEPAERGRTTAASRKKKPAPAREKTRAAKGKERGKTSARRPLAEASIPPYPRTGRGTEQPPAGWPVPPADPRLEDERLSTEVSDRAATRALSERVPTEVSDRALTRLAETEVSDRATTRAVDHDDSERAATRLFRADSEDEEAADQEEEHAATLIFSDRSATVIDSGRQEEATVVASTGRPRPGADETLLETPGSGAYAIPSPDLARKGGTAILRLPPTLPRRRGLFGDVLYIYTAIFGVARARRELAAVDRQLDSEKQARGRRLADLARLTLADTSLESETVTRGREEIIDLEDKRSRKAGAAAAADAKIAGLERERQDDQKRNTAELEALRRKVAEMEEKLEPLQRRLQAARRRAVRLQENLADLDRRVARKVAKVADLGAEQASAAEADIASLRAEREALAQDEPVLAAEVAELEPAIANMVASRADARTRMARIEKEERVASVRLAEKVTAVKARRVVDERAESELAQAQEEALAALGERLGVERPAELGTRLRGIEEHEVAIATLDRRQLELSELVRGVDRWALARGVVWLLAFAVAVAAALVWSLALQTP